MRKRLVVLAVTGVVALALGVPGGSAQAPPCNDTDGDGSPSGFEYAQFHVSAMAKEGMLGNGGHKPGSHRGFSFCM
jgi:hypothetical protein